MPRAQAWSPLGGPQQRFPPSVAAECAAIGRLVGKTPQQVALRWLLQHDCAFVVHSRTAAHLVDDLSVFDFELSQAQLGRLDDLVS